MNTGKLNERVSLMEPIYTTNDYGRNVANGYIHYERWAEFIPKHSKYFSMRFAGGQEAEGILRVHRDTIVEKCNKVTIDDTIYCIQSRIPFGKLYYELVCSENVED